jgi:hypothetical protein
MCLGQSRQIMQSRWRMFHQSVQCIHWLLLELYSESGAFLIRALSNGCSDLIWLFLNASSLRSLSSYASFLYFSMTFSICTWLPAWTLKGDPTFIILVAISNQGSRKSP